jgi:hypothetical protein
MLRTCLLLTCMILGLASCVPPVDDNVVSFPTSIVIQPSSTQVTTNQTLTLRVEIANQARFPSDKVILRFYDGQMLVGEDSTAERPALTTFVYDLGVPLTSVQNGNHSYSAQLFYVATSSVKATSASVVVNVNIP